MNLSVDAPYQARTFESFDGTEIWYAVAGRPPSEAPTLLVVPGLGTPFIAYRRIIERFHRHLHIVTWVMRGSHASATPASGLAGLGVDDHVGDLAALVEHEGLERFTLGGWSAAVQISLEYYRRCPARCEGLLLINGSYGHPLGQTRLIPGIEAVTVRVGAQVAQRLGPVLSPTIRILLGNAWVLELLRAASVVTANLGFFREVVDDFRTQDFGRYFGMMRRLDEHTAEAVLPTVQVPTLVTAGTHDIMTPAATAETMAARIPDADLVVIPRGTHYTPIEYPVILNEAIAGLLRRVYPDLELTG